MKTFFTILILSISYFNYAQTQISISSIDSGGNSVNDGSLSMTYSIGEVVIAETSNSTLDLSEGFIGKFFNPSAVLLCLDSPENIVSWWAGDGNAQDSYGSNHGTQIGGVSYGAGIVNNAFYFDGVDDLVLVPHSADLDITGDVTVELWVRRIGYANRSQTVLCKGAGWVPNDEPAVFLMRFENDLTEFLFEDTNGNNIIINGPAFEDSQFHHYAYTRSGNTHTLYVDGFLFNTDTFSASPASTVGLPLTIGAQYHNPTSSANDYDNFFNGVVDEVGVYNRALTATEIQSIYNAGGDGKCKNALSTHVVTDNGVFIKIYPNPVTDVFTLDFVNSSSFKQGNLKLQIFDLLGKPVKTLNNVKSTKNRIDISALESGIYLYTIQNENGRIKSGKIIKK